MKQNCNNPVQWWCAYKIYVCSMFITCFMFLILGLTKKNDNIFSPFLKEFAKNTFFVVSILSIDVPESKTFHSQETSTCNTHFFAFYAYIKCIFVVFFQHVTMALAFSSKVPISCVNAIYMSHTYLCNIHSFYSSNICNFGF